ncbi:MAG: tetratricopeptide repeat protein [Phycisphaerales bacterium]|nr:MAG: tetratricopeptide repeat protein [Phycisphaerales bacterium]
MTRARSARKPSKKGLKKARTPEEPRHTRPQKHRARFDWHRLLPILVVVAGCIAYYDSFTGVFVLDDDKHIVNNSRIREIWPLSETLRGRRPVVDLSLAVNYKIGQLDVWGYHAFNLAVHLLAGLTLFGVVRRSMLRKQFQSRVRSAAPWFALVAALIWVVHPLQTQSVTYIVQRSESLMGLFYLLTLYCVIRGVDSRYGDGWYVAAVICCALGMGSKAVMVTAPLVVLLYDWIFLSKSCAETLHRRWGLYVTLMLTWSVLWVTDVAWPVLSTAPRAATVGFGFKSITPFQYLATQVGVIAHYVRLSLWPDPLCLDYAWPVARSVREVVTPALLVIPLLLGTLWALLRKSWLGFVGAWFFLTLAPTSSFIPIKDPAFEHRMYLALAAVVVAVVLGGYAALEDALSRLSIVPWETTPRRVVNASLVAMVVALSVYGTVLRNQDYASELTMWRDVLAKSPDNARGHLGLGTAVFNLAKSSDNARGHPGLGTAVSDRDLMEEAEEAFRRAVQLKPSYTDGYYNLGNALAENGKLEEAVAAYRRALQLRPRYAKAHYNLANTLKKQEKFDAAIASYRNALRANPRHMAAHINLGNTLKLQGRLEESIEEYYKALEINPHYANARYNLGDTFRRQGRLEEAMREFQLAVKYDPNHRAAQKALEVMRARLREPQSD